MTSKQTLVMFLRRMAITLGILALAAFVAVQSSTAFAAPAQTATLRLVHVAPDAGPVDVYVDGTKMWSNLQFGTVSTDMAIVAGTHTIQITPMGQNLDATVIRQAVTLNANTSYTIAVLGMRSTGYSLRVFAGNNADPIGIQGAHTYQQSSAAATKNQYHSR